MSDIKPCHRCGEKAHHDEDWGIILCEGCGYYLEQDTMSLEKLIEFWNTRGIEDNLERQLAEAREFKDELVRKLTINKIGALSDKEVVLSLRDYFKEQLKVQGDE